MHQYDQPLQYSQPSKDLFRSINVLLKPGLKLTEADQELYKNFPLVISERWQTEVNKMLMTTLVTTLVTMLVTMMKMSTVMMVMRAVMISDV